MWLTYWCYILILVYNVEVSKQDPIQQSSQELMELFEAKMSDLLEEKFKHVYYKLNKMDTSLTDIKADLAIVKGNVQSMDGEMGAFGERSSLTLTAAQNGKLLHQQTHNALNDIQNTQINSIKELIQEVKQITEDLKTPVNKLYSIDNAIEDIQITQVNSIKDVIHDIKRDTESLKSPVNKLNSISIAVNSIDNAVVSIQNSQVTSSKEIIQQIHRIVDRCPESEGFILSPGSDQCFKVFRDQRRSWPAADSFCKSEGLTLAEPADQNTAWLNNYLNEEYGGHDAGDAYYWVGGRGTGSGSYKWQRSGVELRGDNPLWYPPGEPNDGGGTEFCVFMRAGDEWINKHPGRPYADYGCSNVVYHICEAIQNTDVTSITEIIQEIRLDTRLMKTPIKKLSSIATAVEQIHKIVDRCPESEGFIVSPGGDECFKVFRDQRRSWSAAASFCTSDGMILAEPANQNAAWLNRYLNEKYGGYDANDAYYWVGGRGTGSGAYKWQRSGMELRGDNPLWYPPGEPDDGGGTEFCVFMRAGDKWINKHKGQPYADYGCSTTVYHICERILV